MKLMYDATHVAAGIRNGGRTGIYFVAFNILAELVKRSDIDLTLYCENRSYFDLLHELALHFPDKKFKIKTDLKFKNIAKIYSDLYQQKGLAKANNRKFLKFILQIKLLFMSAVLKFASQLTAILPESYEDYDLFLSPMYKFPNKISKAKNLKRFLFLHDVIPLVLDDYPLNGWFKDVVESLNNKDYYFANSDYTRIDFLKHCPEIDPNKIRTTLLACNDKFRPVSVADKKIVKQKYNIPLDKKYVFSLCSLESRKNLIRVVKTFIQFIKTNNIEDIIFVLGGPSSNTFIELLDKEIGGLGKYKENILKIGYVNDEDLAPLYSGAEWFMYTSQYEGFGLPPLEAMSCGCPVITSNNSSLPEVVGDAGVMIDWDSDEQHIEAYEKYYFNEELRKEYAQKGLERAKQFSWKKCVDEMLEVMKNDL